MGGGVLLLERRPWLAGALFGCLTLKPHLALLIPLVLAARGLWRPFVAAGLTSVGLVALSAAVFGLERWQAFFANAALARTTFESVLFDPAKIQLDFFTFRGTGRASC